MWLQMDIFDLVTDKCEWGEVSLWGPLEADILQC